jgi:hypothetical protein
MHDLDDPVRPVLFVVLASNQSCVRKHVQAQMSGKSSLGLLIVILEGGVLCFKPLLMFFRYTVCVCMWLTN